VATYHDDLLMASTHRSCPMTVHQTRMVPCRVLWGVATEPDDDASSARVAGGGHHVGHACRPQWQCRCYMILPHFRSTGVGARHRHGASDIGQPKVGGVHCFARLGTRSASAWVAAYSTGCHSRRGSIVDGLPFSDEGCLARGGWTRLRCCLCRGSHGAHRRG